LRGLIGGALVAHTLDVKRLDEVFDAIKSKDVSFFSAWEIDFIESVEAQWKGQRSLSGKQLEILARIYLKVCGVDW